MKKNKELIFVILITIFALFLRWIAILNRGDFWIDELFSINCATPDNLIGVFKMLLKDTHAPLYFVGLHFWMKLFGQSDFVIRLFGTLISTLIIPVGFYIVKDIFNRRAAYFAMIFFAISAFCIHYSVEVRFYGSIGILSLLSAYYFTKYLQKQDGKNTTLMVLCNTLLLYTFNLSFLYVFIQGIIGIFYLKKDAKKYIKPLALTGIIYIPAFAIVLNGVLTYQTSISNYTKDIYNLDFGFIWIFFQSTFSNLFEQITNNASADIIFKDFYTLRNFIFGIIPVSFWLCGLCNGIKNITNKKELEKIIFITPAILFLIGELILASFGKMPMLARYTALSFPIFICIGTYGLSLFKREMLVKNLYILITIIGLFFYLISPISAVKYHITGYGLLNRALKQQVDYNDNDVIFMPNNFSLAKRYLTKGTLVDFDTHKLSLLNEEKYIKLVFGKHPSKQEVKDYILSNNASPELEKYLTSKFIDEMKPGDRFIFIIDEAGQLSGLLELFANKRIDEEKYNKISTHYLLTAKIVHDGLHIANKYLKQKQVYPFEEGDFVILIFEK